MKIIAIDSSSITASVALIEDENIISEFFMNAGLTHSQTLAPMIKSILELSKTKPEELDLFCASNGPGSFTGLRIGMASIKAMALAYDRPCIGISSLHALAYNFKNSNDLICCCMDARRKCVYNALFCFENGVMIRQTPDRAIEIKTLAKELENSEKNICFVGDGSLICYNYMKQNFGHNNTCNIYISPIENRYIKASNIAYLAKKMYKNDQKSDACTVGLNYLKVSQAERLLNENKLNV